MTLTVIQAKQHVAQAVRGHFRALGTLLRELVDGTLSLDGLTVDDVALTATMAEINAVADASARIVATTATALTITAALHAHKVVLVNSAEPIAITLPLALGTGDRYTFVIGVSATGTDHTIKVASAADVLTGVALLANTDATEVSGFATTSGSDTISMDGTALGGVRGARIELIDIETGAFQVTMTGKADNAVATPFLMAVS